ncbi:transcriptional regulator [Arthrobacter sp. Leaf337]|uniref:TetR/AcrR family transcriptional regulator n=1 Tax=Arthrobacter sp. Leaf337 TaxID=1736342 RepID=UPI0006F24F9D|nr:TetR/AcrR family transcriptional regulator [Arthrobacter sp. Leaf337]KQR65375.1 transcriptional regulator [Arthrobacter sp. Leaf337]
MPGKTTAPTPASPKVTRRTAQAADTRLHIVATARRLFLANGYVRTTIEGIAVESGVAVQTVYNSVGNKAALLSAVLDAAASGPNAPVQVLEFMRERTRRAPDLESMLAVLADWFVEVHQRTGAVLGVIAQAAAVDTEVAKLEKARALQRLTRYHEAAAAVRERGGLTSGMSDEDAAAAIWSLGHPQAYRTLVNDAGWTPEAYREWMLRALAAALA